MVHQIKTKAELEEKVSEAGDKLVVVDFFATWCGPCKRVAPVFDELAQQHEGKSVMLKVDVDEVEELVSEHAVQIMPTFVFIRQGKVIHKQVGSNEDTLKESIIKYINP